jgi:hypothetical protein
VAFAFAMVALLLSASAFAQCPVLFGPPTTYPLGFQAGGVAFADFDLDGRPEVILTDALGTSVSIREFSAAGVPQAPTFYTVGSQPHGIAVGDLNNDGRPDFVVANSLSNTISVFIAAGPPGNFNPPVTYNTLGQPRGLALGHFNGDTYLDLAVACASNGAVSVMMGNGIGGFQAAVNYGTGSGATAVVAGDFNGDGIDDLAVANQGANTVSIFRGFASGTFVQVGNYPVGTGPNSIVAADLNGDGVLDLATSNFSSNNVSVLLGNGGPQLLFQAAVNYPTHLGPAGIATGPINADGVLDLVTATSNSNILSVLSGNIPPAQGTFASPSPFSLGSSNCAALAVRDVNGDGKPDIVAATTAGGGALVVLLNTSPPVAVPVITQQPAPQQTIVAGSPAMLSVQASGANPLTYQWRKNTVPLTDGGHISGAATATLTINPALAADAGGYDVQVSMTGCAGGAVTTTSNFGVINVDSSQCAPAITQQPTPTQSVAPGSQVMLSVVANGFGNPLSYQWRKGGAPLADGANISGSLTPTLTISPTMAGDGGSYDVRVSMVACGGVPASTISSPGVVNIDTSQCAPAITQQPNPSQSVAAGTPVTLSVVVNGFGQPLTYQWRKDGALLTDGSDFSGSATPTLTISPAVAADAGSYDVLVSMVACGGVTSSTLSNPGVISIDESQCATGWNLLEPSGRMLHAMAYDSARHVSVLFGGANGGDSFAISTTTSLAPNATLEWDGTKWTQVAVGGPSPRYGCAMAYDSARGVTVLFGGSTGGGETWEWNGTAWTQRNVPGPFPRSRHAMAYDSARGVTVLFGGSVGGNETWEWNGTVWTQRNVAGPSQRSGHGMVYDSARGVTVLFGGSLGATYYGDTWEWDGTTWTQRMVAGPDPRSLGAMAYDSARGVTVLMGGFVTNSIGGLMYDEVWEWNGTTWSGRPRGPYYRYRDAMCYDSSRGVAVLFGGYAGDPDYNYIYALSDTWEWDGNAWAQPGPGGLPPRQDHAIAFDSARGSLVLFGGSSPSPQYQGYFNDTWSWDGAHWNKLVVTGPGERVEHAMAYDAAHGQTVLFGGSNGDTSTWTWDGSAWTERVVSGPSARRDHAMAYDSARNVVVLFGGTWSSGANGETWEWDGSSWTQRLVSGPPAQSGHAMAYDSLRGVTVLVGAGQTWEWDGATWTQRSTSGPSARTEHSLYFDQDRGVTVLFGGFATALSDEMWEWNGNAWTQVFWTGPLARQRHVMAYDPIRHNALLIGGLDNGTEGDVWEFALCGPPVMPTQPADQVVCVGNSVSLSAAAIGCGPISYQWRKDGVNVNDEPGHISGAHAPTLTINTAAMTDASFAYVCVTANHCGVTSSNPARLTVNSADFNGDGDIGTDADLEAYFACLGGDCCPSCGAADFNADRDIGTDADIESFFRVLAGGPC